MQHAEHAGVKVSDENVNQALEDVAKRNNMTLAQLPDAMAQQGIDYATYREEIAQGDHAAAAAPARRAAAHQHHAARDRPVPRAGRRKTPSATNEYNVSHILIAVGAGGQPGAARRGRQARPGGLRARQGRRGLRQAGGGLLQQPDRARWRRARLAQGQRAADLPHRRGRAAQARRGQRAAAHADRLPHRQAQRGARRRRRRRSRIRCTCATSS